MRDLIPFLKLYKKHWFGLSLGMLLAFLTLLASMGLLTISGWFLSAAAVAGLTVARETFNYMLPSGFVRGFAMGRTAGRWGERVVSHSATFKVLADLRIFFFERLAPLVPGKVGNIRDADMLNRIVTDVDSMDHVYLRLVSPVLVAIAGIVSVTVLLCWFDMQIGLTLGALLIVMVISWPILFYRLGKKNGINLTMHRADLRISLLDWVQGFTELTLFGAEKRYRHQIDTHQDALIETQKYNTLITGMSQALLLLVNGWMLLLMLWLAADGVGGAMQDPLIAMVVFATLASFELLMPLAGAFQHLGQTLSSAKRLNEVLEAKPEVVFPQQIRFTPAKSLSVAIRNVNFSYPDSTQQILNQVNIEIGAQQKLAIVGQTGSGKSTLLQLLCRHWDVQQGHIEIDGEPITNWSESQLRSAISVVSQRVDILNGTLEDNLRLAAPEATDAQFAEVLEQVGLMHLLDGTGLNTWLGDGGRQLSGGEKRRIGIARALLHNAPIMLLDEPTEGLDKQTERHIMSLLLEHAKDKTLVFITHRLIDLDKMDAVCLLEKGEVVELGAHKTLLNNKGRYWQLNQTL